MAKKVLTPEQAEIKAMKKAKKSENWTKFWAILLAAVLTVAVVFMGQTAAEDAIAKATAGQTTDGTATNNDGSSAATQDPWNDGSTGTDAGTSTPAGDTGSSAPAGDAGSSAPAGDAATSTADAVKAINDATAKAAKGSYSFKRVGTWKKAIDVGGATGTLNTIIQGVDENADLNSVVGGFLGINTLEANIANGKYVSGKKDGSDIDVEYHNTDKTDYLLKATTLKESDIASCQVNGNTYTIRIKDTTNPDAGSAWANASNDYITVEKVNTSISSAVGSAVVVQKDGTTANYQNITLTVEIVGGKLTSFSYSYTLDAVLNIKAAIIPITGKGAAEIKAEYKNFK